MPTIRPSDYLDRLAALAAKHSVATEKILVVPSIQSWCEEQGVEETNPWRSGRILQNRETDAFLILLAEEITEDMQASVRDSIELRGLLGQVKVIEEPLAFLDHLMLHELAHALYPKASETECDRWAFVQLGDSVAGVDS
jgi:hypothetical protein